MVNTMIMKSLRRPPMVEIHQSTVAMALPSKPASEQKAEDSYLLFGFADFAMTMTMMTTLMVKAMKLQEGFN